MTFLDLSTVFLAILDGQITTWQHQIYGCCQRSTQVRSLTGLAPDVGVSFQTKPMEGRETSDCTLEIHRIKWCCPSLIRRYVCAQNRWERRVGSERKNRRRLCPKKLTIWLQTPQLLLNVKFIHPLHKKVCLTTRPTLSTLTTFYNQTRDNLLWFIWGVLCILNMFKFS